VLVLLSLMDLDGDIGNVCDGNRAEEEAEADEEEEEEDGTA
jgi:hypothetical protein